MTRYGDETRTSLQLALHGTSGRSGGAPVTRGLATGSLEVGLVPLIASGTAGKAATSSPFEQFTLGGLTPVLLHPAVLSQRIAMPVLPSSYATGKSLLMYRLSAPVVGYRAYYWAAKVGTDSTSRWERVTGLEWNGVLPQIAAIGTPTARFTVGVGVWLGRQRSSTPAT